MGQIDQLQATVDPIDRWLRAYARRQPGCRALVANHYGIGQITAPTILAELGDVRRFRNGDAVVRYTGLDVTVYSSGGKRSPGIWPAKARRRCAGHCSRPPWPTRRGPPHPTTATTTRSKTASVANGPGCRVARKLARRIRFTLAELGDDALVPVDEALLPDLPLPRTLELTPAAA